MELKPMITGVAYHGNRMLTHVRADMEEIAKQGFNCVVHMFSHNDWDRHKNIMGEIFKITADYGLDIWVDNWGLGGPPGDKSHFLAYHPEAHQYYNDGEMDPVRACYNHESFVQFTKDWIDVVYDAGGRKIFWDEPHLVQKEMVNKIPGKWACRCEKCQEIFKEKYGMPMPSIFTPEVEEFRVWSIANYFKTVADYAKSKGMYNTICVMLGDEWGVNLDNIASLCSVESLDCIGSDPYWLGHEEVCGYQAVYDFVYKGTKTNLDVCKQFGKDHNVWIQTYHNPMGREEEIIAAADAMYDAGARNIFAWGYRGSDANDYRSTVPDVTWKVTCDAYARLSERYRNEQLEIARKRNNI